LLESRRSSAQKEIQMEIGIGLPAAIPGVKPKMLIEWARNAEQAGFKSISVLDRLVFDNYEALTTLAAAAAVTSSLRLVTSVLLAPLHTNVALLAKQAATLDSLSGGRLLLGFGVGNREDDFEAAKADFHHRGRFMDRQIEELRRIWRGEGGIGPPPARPGGPEIVIGGRSEAALRRAARLADGWMQGGGGPGPFRDGAETVRAEWSAAGRPGKPVFFASARFALGPNAAELATASHRAYYNFSGARQTDPTGGALMTPDAIRGVAAEFEQLGCDELIFGPGVGELSQVDQLAKILF
jgi:alkanesulfonate monooxygenase SsuD/methylene tetrahydromethanopterin reductase-like flavin-dependent oxidoreductase (luciferase family)